MEHPNLYFQFTLNKRTVQISKVWIQRGILIVLLFFFLWINLGSIEHKSFTTDELKHYQYGENILNLDSSRFDDSKMPFSALNALPKKIAPDIPIGRVRLYFEKVESGRLVTILFSLGVAFLVYFWSKSLYGPLAGLFALFLYVFDPNIIAHSRLMTTDLYATGMISLSIFVFWHFSKTPNWKTATWCALVLGLAQIAKYSSAYLYPIIAIIALLRYLPKLSASLRSKSYRSIWHDLLVAGKFGTYFILVSIVIINIGFLFNQTLMPLEDYTFRSELFRTIQEKLTPIGAVPVPVPQPYVEGLDWVQARERTGEGYGDIYLLGERRSGENFMGYYIVASLLKVPVATQIFILLGLALYFVHRKKYQFLENEIFLFVPLAFFFLYFNFIFRAQIGIRFYLVIFPLLYVLCGNLVQTWAFYRPKVKIAGGVLAIYLVTSVLVHYPHYIPYFNELIWDQKNAYKYLVDSNLDWNQGEWYLDQYLAANPLAKFEPLNPTLDTIVVSPNKLVGVEGDPEQFRWLRDNYEPVDTIADVYLVFEISAQERDQIQYENSGE